MKFFQVKEVKDAKVEEKKKEEVEAEEEKTVKREGMMVDSGKDVVDLVLFSDIIFLLIILIKIIILIIIGQNESMNLNFKFS